MLNKLRQFLKAQNLIAPGGSVTCALSGGADSVAMTYGLLLLREELDISLSAAHFNHHLRGAESDRDEDFVREFCKKYEISLTVGSGNVIPGGPGAGKRRPGGPIRFFRHPSRPCCHGPHR